jgi:hypothetical protein
MERSDHKVYGGTKRGKVNSPDHALATTILPSASIGDENTSTSTDLGRPAYPPGDARQ